MAVAITLKQFLSQRNIPYDEVTHDRTATSLETAATAHIPGDSVAKAVLLADSEGEYIMAVLPATYHLDLDLISQEVGRVVCLADEEDISDLFTDCKVGAIPPAGAAYGIRMVWDDRLNDVKDVYFEGGDHSTLVHVTGSYFQKMLGNAPHAVISHHI